MYADHIKSYTLPVFGPKDTEIFSFSDNHGHLNLLNAAVNWIGHQTRLASKREVVNIGDNIDRGPDSGYTIARGALANLDDIYLHAKADKITEIMGNHEQMMLHSIGLLHSSDTQYDVNSQKTKDLQFIAKFLYNRNNGAEYLSDINTIAEQHGNLEKRDEILAAWFETLKKSYTAGNILYVHGGINLNVSLSENLEKPYLTNFTDQNELENSIFWITDNFLPKRNIVEKTGVFIMHGHTWINSKHESGDLDICHEYGRMNHDNRTWKTNVQRVCRIVNNQLDVFDVTP